MKTFAVLILATSLVLYHVSSSENRITINGREYIIDSELYDRQGAKSVCQSHGAQLIIFETEQEQIDVTQYLYTYDYPFQRGYWTDGIRSLDNLNVFLWESSGVEIDQSLWAPNEPNPSMDNSWVFFLTEGVKLITGMNVYSHSVICEKY